MGRLTGERTDTDFDSPAGNRTRWKNIIPRLSCKAMKSNRLTKLSIKIDRRMLKFREYMSLHLFVNNYKCVTVTYDTHADFYKLDILKKNRVFIVRACLFNSIQVINLQFCTINL